MIKNIVSKLKDKTSYYLSNILLDKLSVPKIENSAIGQYPYKKILICILHGKVNKYRVDYLSKYYKKYIKDIDFIFYSDYTDIKNNVVKVSTCNTYSSNELKHVNVLNLLLKKNISEKYSFLLFVDDDTYVNMELLLRLIDEGYFNKWFIYGELLGNENNSTNKVFLHHQGLRYLSGGAGYLVPSILMSKKPFFKNFRTGFSDVSFGLNLDQKLFCNSTLFHSQNHKFYGIGLNEISNYLTFHYIKNESEFDLYASNNSTSNKVSNQNDVEIFLQ